MAYKRIRLLITFDPTRGLCEKVVPRMKELLEQRAFEVDVAPLTADAATTLDLEPYRGVIIGAPITGTGLRHDDPSELVKNFIEQAEGLDEKKVALYTVYALTPGKMLRKMRDLTDARGCVVVVDHAYNRLRPQDDEHILPAECMCRIRGPA